MTTTAITLPAPGTHLPEQGGIFIGITFIDSAPFGVVAPALGDYAAIVGAYHTDYTEIEGASSSHDAAANTAAILAAGSPIAQAITGLTINGHSDWAIASKLDSAMAHAHAPETLPDRWIHTSTQYSADDAWSQYPNGYQYWSCKKYVGAVLPVRRFPLPI